MIGHAPQRKEKSAQAASAARARQTRSTQWLDLATTRATEENVAYQQRRRLVESGLAFLDPLYLGSRQASVPSLRGGGAGELDEWLEQEDSRIRATDKQLSIAEDRAKDVARALDLIYPGAEQYRTGSVEHGDALSPLNDVDLGVILTDRPDLGPGKDQSGPQEEMRKTADRLKEILGNKFPNLTVTTEGKRSIILDFDPQANGDFTCDVILALPVEGGDLLIPNTDIPEGWDVNDPIGHAKLLRQAKIESNGSLQRTVRLVKHWRDLHGKPLYSWNIKTLALETGSQPISPSRGCSASSPMRSARSWKGRLRILEA